MRRRLFALSSSTFVMAALVIGVPACVGDDPAAGGTPSSTDDGGTPGSGVTCSAATPCATGTCVDGFCCESACTGLCEACNVPGSEGRCVAVTGEPVHGKCDGDVEGVCAGRCNGTERNACTYPDVECGKGSCAGGTATIAPKCKSGTCPAPQPQTCALGCHEDECLGVVQLAAGYYHACAVLTDGKVRCWGANEVGEAGQFPSNDPVTTPKEVFGLSNVKAVSATFHSTCALLGDGTVKCWGANVSGQLGRGADDSNPHHVPELVQGLTGVTFLNGSSGGHYCAIVSGGTLKCWGANGAGQIGDGTQGTGNDKKASPTTVCQPDVVPCTPSTGATFVAGGDGHTCAVFAGNKVACWGANGSGEAGQPPGANQPLAKSVANLTATYLTAGNQLTCAATTTGGAKCWGTNFDNGRLGNGVDTGMFGEPQSVCTKQDCSQLLSGVTAVTTYDESSCAIANGAVKCWGINTGGQLGDGNNSSSQNYAATTAIAAGAVQITSGGQANYAVVIDGVNRDVRCWGNEGSNQCGDGTPSVPRKTPIAPKW